jgi:formylglycine-generating enzyme required for sulfatase activity
MTLRGERGARFEGAAAMTITTDYSRKTPRAPARPNMLWIPSGSFTMGSNDHYPEERPARKVSVSGFWMDVYPVTNRDFARFVDATGWVTSAEIAPNAADYPGALPEQLVPASLVFTPTDGPVDLRDVSNWWRYIPGADWRHPYGPETTLDGLMNHPVIHVAWRDVTAYAEWAGAELPREAEWEFAARGGLEGAVFAWGDEFQPAGAHMANVWQGNFPYHNATSDGWTRTSPVGAFRANGYGLYDMIGNVWEWTADWWSTAATRGGTCCAVIDPRHASIDPRDACAIPRKVLKGGSHLCAPNYCQRYRPAARHAHAIDTSTSHIGFRCVVRRAA